MTRIALSVVGMMAVSVGACGTDAAARPGPPPASASPQHPGDARSGVVGRVALAQPLDDLSASIEERKAFESEGSDEDIAMLDLPAAVAPITPGDLPPPPSAPDVRNFVSEAAIALLVMTKVQEVALAEGSFAVAHLPPTPTTPCSEIEPTGLCDYGSSASAAMAALAWHPSIATGRALYAYEGTPTAYTATAYIDPDCSGRVVMIQVRGSAGPDGVTLAWSGDGLQR